jgi:hypothetical protein
MKKAYLCFFVFFTAICDLALANVPYRAVINGPQNIGCNSVFQYKATLEGLPESYIHRVFWYPCFDVSYTSNGQFALVTAPSEPTSFVLECDVYIGPSSNPYLSEILHASISITAAVPSFNFSREDLFATYVSNSSVVPIYGNVDFDGNQSVKDGSCNGAFYDDELLYFNIDPSDTTLRINRGKVKLSIPTGFRLWTHLYRQTLLGNGGDNIEINLSNDVEILDALYYVVGWVEAQNIDLNKSFTFSFDSDETTLPYKSYGLTNGNNKPSNYDSIKSAVASKLPHVADCQWRIIGNAVSSHNNIAYAVEPDPPNPNIYNNKYFCVYKTTPLCPNVYVLTDYNGVWATSMDTFGDRNESFSMMDVYAFFNSSLWGNMPSVNSIDCKVVYFSNFFAAHCWEATGYDVLYNGWRLFRAKINGVLIAFVVENMSEVYMAFGYNAPPQPL